MKQKDLQHVFIIGCKGIPARYGGFETFVDRLTAYQKDRSIRYHVACACEPEAYRRENARFTYHGADCVTFPWHKIGPARAVTYDLEALRFFLHEAQKRRIAHPVFYILACRIGPFIRHVKRRVDALGGRLYINPDGHEFLRAKWAPPIRRYWKYSEKQMVGAADLVICDSKNIQAYIKREYAPLKPKTVYIAYGAEPADAGQGSDEKTEALCGWYAAHGLKARQYYLVVGRFVPENNYETMIREFMRSDTTKTFVLITDVSDGFLQKLKQRTGFDRDARICFAGTVYDQAILKEIRKNAYAYFHGHEVGGTNPSLLEALACTDLNLLLDIGFNREVAADTACYWTKEKGDLAALIDRADRMDPQKIRALGVRARARMADCYSWESIAQRYEETFSG